jgi:hypothetical protein
LTDSEYSDEKPQPQQPDFSGSLAWVKFRLREDIKLLQHQLDTMSLDSQARSELQETLDSLAERLVSLDA